MLIKNRSDWALPERLVTPESIFLNRRAFMGGTGRTIAAAAAFTIAGCDNGTADSQATGAGMDDPTGDLYPVLRNGAYEGGRALTPESITSEYNNFYEFGSHKRIASAAQALKIRPWTVEIDGEVEAPMTLDIDGLIRQMPLEERIYRHRCVEAWSMVVPWSGFPMRSFVDLAKPLSTAKFIRMETFMDPDMASGQKAHWYPWPYAEALTMAEATNELAFLVTGVYGKPMAKQFGAPLRLAVPWKYGFKSIKSIVRFSFVKKKPETFWESIGPKEYGFWANVNPEVPHPRWSQTTEKKLSTGERIPTQLYNGYGEQVASLYEGLSQRNLFR